MTFFYSRRISLLELDFFKSCCFICQCSSFVHQLQVQWHSTNFYIELTFVVYLKVFKFCFVLLKNFTLISHSFGVFFIYIQAQNVQHSKDMTLASNRSLAEGNLLYQPKLESLKSNLTEKYQELQVLFEAYQIKKTKLGNTGC